MKYNLGDTVTYQNEQWTVNATQITVGDEVPNLYELIRPVDMSYLQIEVPQAQLEEEAEC